MKRKGGRRMIKKSKAKLIGHPIWTLDTEAETLRHIRCLGSYLFGGTCECINHTPIATYHKSDFTGGEDHWMSQIDAIEWEEGA
jgi:hypothetical protein